MPLPLIPLIAAGTSLLGQGINAASQGSMNKKTRQWNEKMHGLTRQESLADFTMQNEYNSPSSQMQRLRDAKLNPNLVYGTGAVANSSSPIKPAGVESWSPQAPQINLGGVAASGIDAYYDTRLKEAQTDNVKTMNTVNAIEGLLKLAQIDATHAGTDATVARTNIDKFSLDLQNELRKTTVEAQSANLDKTKAETSTMLARNEREIAMNASSIREAAERILTLRSQRTLNEPQKREIEARIENLQKDNRLKQLDIDLREKGIQPGDAIYWRVLARLIGGGSLEGIITDRKTHRVGSALDSTGVIPKKR